MMSKDARLIVLKWLAGTVSAGTLITAAFLLSSVEITYRQVQNPEGAGFKEVAVRTGEAAEKDTELDPEVIGLLLGTSGAAATGRVPLGSKGYSLPGGTSDADFVIKGLANINATLYGDTAAFPGAEGWGGPSTFGGHCPRGDSALTVVWTPTDTLEGGASAGDSSLTHIGGVLTKGISASKLDYIAPKVSGYNDMLGFGPIEVQDSCLVSLFQTAPGPYWIGGGADFNQGVNIIELVGTNSHHIWRGGRYLGSQSVADGGANVTNWQVGAEGAKVNYLIFSDNFHAHCSDICWQPQSGDGSGGSQNNPGWEDKKNITIQKSLFGYTQKTTYGDQGSKRLTFSKNASGPGTRHRIPEFGEGDSIQVANTVVNPNSNDKRPISARQPDTIPVLHIDLLGNLVLSGRGGPGGGVNVRPLQIGNSDSDWPNHVNMVIHADGNVADTVRGTNGVSPSGDKTDPDASAWGDTASNTGCFIKDSDGFCADSTVFKLASPASAPIIPLTIWAAWEAWDSLVSLGLVGAWWSVDSLGRWVDTRDTMQALLINQILTGTGPLEEDSAKYYFTASSDGFPHGLYDVDKFTLGSDPDGDGTPTAWEQACGYDPNSKDSWKRDAGQVWTNIERWANGNDEFGIRIQAIDYADEDSAQVERFPAGGGSWAYFASMDLPGTDFVDRDQFSRGDSIRVRFFKGTTPFLADAQIVGCF